MIQIPNACDHLDNSKVHYQFVSRINAPKKHLYSKVAPAAIDVWPSHVS